MSTHGMSKMYLEMKTGPMTIIMTNIEMSLSILLTDSGLSFLAM